MNAEFEALLKGLDDRGRRRHLADGAGLDFASNDYLGLARSPDLAAAVVAAIERGVPVGAGASRLLRGNDPEHETLEREAAALFGSETALYFQGGFTANSAIFSTLPQRGDLVVHDELIHASVRDGLRAGRADSRGCRHNDPQAVEDTIEAWRQSGGVGRVWIAVESIYSMDGDRAPLAELSDIAARHDAMLVIDEAHATGVVGSDGRGLATDLADRANVIVLHTCGKALGASGALVCLSATLREFMINRCRPFIYATAPSPLMAAAVRAALKLSHTDVARRDRLAALVEHAAGELQQICGVAPSGSQIMPVIIGDDRRTVAISEAMQGRGFDVRAIRPPTVPEGTARLRLSITLNVDAAAVSRMVRALQEELARNGGRP